MNELEDENVPLGVEEDFNNGGGGGGRRESDGGGVVLEGHVDDRRGGGGSSGGGRRRRRGGGGVGGGGGDEEAAPSGDLEIKPPTRPAVLLFSSFIILTILILLVYIVRTNLVQTVELNQPPPSVSTPAFVPAPQPSPQQRPPPPPEGSVTPSPQPLPSLPPSPEPSSVRVWDSIRLPNSLLPRRYNITTVVSASDDREEWSFDGHTIIVVEVLISTKYVILHSLDLNITEMYVSSESGSGQKYKGRYWEDEEYEFLIFESPQLENVSIGTMLAIHIHYQAIVKESMEGFYKSRYQQNNSTSWLLVTDFEPTKARKAFPCFDEPAMKSIFKIQIIAPSDYNVLSNMPLETAPIVLSSNQKSWIFEDSKLMSTYLVCYCVHKFESLEAFTPTSNVTVRVWAPPSELSQAQYALEVATTVLDYYENYFQIEYPLPKLDLIAIPNFAAGAMENWGLITFRETALLYDPNVSSLDFKMFICSVISHELAHQWFGNLVTMKWWDDLWLNEGFASFVEYIGMDAKEPSWNSWQLFSSTDRESALTLDALSSTHPISVEVLDPDSIGEIFDAISYQKGASVLVMLRYFLNNHKEGSFEAGITSYLRTYAYRNAETNNLWEELSKSSGLDVALVMNTWTKQGGFPLINFSTSPKGYTAHQIRFYFGGKDNVTNTTEALWYVPLTYQIDNLPPKTLSMYQESMELSINDTSSLIVFNYGQFGFYRVQYPVLLRQNIIITLNQNVNALNVSDKVGFLSDLFALQKSMIISPTELLSSLDWLKNENDPIVWSTSLNGLSSIGRKISLVTPYYYKFQTHIRTLFTPMIESLAWNISNNDTFLFSLYKGRLLMSAGINFNDKSVQDTALQLLNLFQGGKIDIPTDLKLSVFCLNVMYGGPDRYFWILNRYKTNNVPTEREICLFALSCTQDPSLIQYTLNIAIDPAVVLTQDSLKLIGNLASHGTLNAHMAWDFFKQNYKQFQESRFILDQLINSILGRFSTQVKLDEVQSFFASHPLKNAARAIQQGLEIIENNIEWINKYSTEISIFLENLV